MPETKTEQNKKQDCDCSDCCGGGYHHANWMHGHVHRFLILRVFLMCLILFIVFMVGVKIGEFKSEIRGIYGDGQYFRHNTRIMDQLKPNYRYNMMYFNTSTTPVKLP